MQLTPHPIGAIVSDGPTTVPCGNIQANNGSDAVWSAAHSPYILPLNDPNLPVDDPAHPNCLRQDPLHHNALIADDIYLPAGMRLLIDASEGPVQIFSHGTGIVANGGTFQTTGTGPSNTITFDAEPDVASWDGLTLSTGLDQANQTVRANGQFDYTSIQHALTAISINSGSTALTGTDSRHYGLIVTNGGIGPSYFDGIDAINTPIQVVGQDDGRFGTLNNIGSQGLKVTFDPSLPNYPSQALDSALDVEKVVFGSSVPFAESTCVPLQPCGAGSIGNDAIQAQFAPGRNRVTLTQNRFYRAGSFAVELHDAAAPAITNNTFICNGSGSPKPVVSCDGTLLRFPAIYLDNMTAEILGPGTTVAGGEGVHGNVGQQNGLDAIALNGTVTSDLEWQTPTNSSQSHVLGYIVANRDLEMARSTRLTVRNSDVVKVTGGAIKLNGATLDASDPGTKIFTSLRDNSSGIAACPSVFVQSCPDPLPSNEWTGISMVSGADASITDATIAYATTGIQDISGALSTSLNSTYGGLTYGNSFGLVVNHSLIGPSFANGISAGGSPIAVVRTTFSCPATVSPVPACPNSLSTGNEGVIADFGQSGSLGGGLLLDGNTFVGTVNEGINGVALGNQTVSIKNNKVDKAGTYGIRLQNARHPTVISNKVTNSGAGSPLYPAVYLPGLEQADFNTAISGNYGAGNGLDSIAFDGIANGPLNWQPGIHNVAETDSLGFLLDGSLEVDGPLTVGTSATVPVLHGLIKVRQGGLTTSAGAVFTSLKEVACDTIFAPRVSSTIPNTPFICQAPAANDWYGLDLDGTRANTMTGTDVRYPTAGIRIDALTTPATGLLKLTDTNIVNVLTDGIHTESPIAMTDGKLINSTASLGAGIWTDNATNGAIQLSGVSVDHAGTYGIVINGATNPTLKGNTVLNSGLVGPSPAIYLDGVTDPNFLAPQDPVAAQSIQSNAGSGNGLDALAFHGTLTTGDLTWQTARRTVGAPAPLGYLLDGDLNLQSGTLVVNAGDVVKTSGAIKVARLEADDSNLPDPRNLDSSPKIFTSLTDDAVGVQACHSVLVLRCAPAAADDWLGISLGSDGALVNADIRYARNALRVSSGAAATFGSSSYGLVVSRSRIESTKDDAITTLGTAISVTDSSIIGAGRGVNADLTNGVRHEAIRLSGDRFSGTVAEAVVGTSLQGHPTWIADNQVRGAGTFGIRLLNADALVLRNNFVGESTPGAVAYPAIYLSGVSADFVQNIRGNVGRHNALNAIAMHGTVTSDLNWVTPSAPTTTAVMPLGYMLDAGLTVKGHDLNLKAGDVVKALGGPITISGGSLNAAADAGPKTFTSWKDDALPTSTVPNIFSCPTFFGPCGAAAGDWGGLLITDAGASKGNGALQAANIKYADTGISIDSGPIASGELTNARLTVSNSTIINTSRDGINALDTPIDVEKSQIGQVGQITSGGIVVPNVGAHGIIASFLSPANCASTLNCLRLKLDKNFVYWTGKDGIVANGLAGQPVEISGNHVDRAATYGIRLVGADMLKLAGNDIWESGLGTTAYPAIYLNGVNASFYPLASGVIGNTNTELKPNGLDAIVFHGTAQGDLTWQTPGRVGANLGYMLDGGLTVTGSFNATADNIVKVLHGGITVGRLVADRTIFTSLKDNPGMAACASVFVPTACPTQPLPPTPPVTLAAAGDWDGISINGSANSTFTGSQVLYASTALSNGGPGRLSVDCSSIRSNGTGIRAVGNDSITQSDVYRNTTNLVATSGVMADSDWFGSGPQAGATNQLQAQQPAATLTPASVNPVPATGPPPALGIGNMTVTAAFSRKMANVAIPPAVFGLKSDGTFPHSLTSTTAGSGFSLGRTAWTYDPYLLNLASAKPGLNTLHLDGARSCVPPEAEAPDSNLMTPGQQDFIAAIKPTTLVANNAEGAFGGTASLRASLADSDTAQGLANEPVTFLANVKPFGPVMTAASPNAGVASVAGASLVGIPAGTYSGLSGVQAKFAGDPVTFYSPAAATGVLKVDAPPTTTPSAGGGLGTSLTDSISEVGGPIPGGSATFKLYASDPSCTATNLVASSTVSLLNGKASSPGYQATSAGTYRWIVDYSGDGYYVSSTGTCGDAVTITSHLATTTQLTSAPTDLTTSLTRVSLKATVTPSWSTQAVPADGTVSFSADGTILSCAAGSTTGLALTSGSNAVTCVTDYGTIRGKGVTANYSGTTSGTIYDPSAGKLLGSTTGLASNQPAGIASGLTVVLSATVAPSSADGTVDFFDGMTSIPGCTNLPVTAGLATCSYGIVGVGTHPLTAIYSGSGTYEGSEGTFTQTVGP